MNDKIRKKNPKQREDLRRQHLNIYSIEDLYTKFDRIYFSEQLSKIRNSPWFDGISFLYTDHLSYVFVGCS